ncbi:WD domain-containing protein [Thozetella sp. PMI_491]|nr:WD domain-containing protein [Thozetella sp. PMI_491]
MASSTLPTELRLEPLAPFKPELYQRAWASVPHPTLPLLATSHSKAVTIYSLSNLTKHSALTGGHTRSVRCATWKPNLPPHQLCVVTGSFDSTAGLWRYDGDSAQSSLETEVTSSHAADPDLPGAEDKDQDDWEFTLVLEGHENEIKSVAFSPTGQYLATSSRDKSVWIWEDVGATEGDDEWETVAVLNEHDGDVKAVAWCPDVPGRSGRGRYSADVLASASYDNTVRIWREDSDGEWVCVAVLEGHQETVWGLQWESRPRGNAFPRLLTFSADTTIRIWTLREESEEDEAAAAAMTAGFGRIPNTMRRSLREEWDCTDVLPKTHTRDIYSVSWSETSGLVASTGSDGLIAVYGEEENPVTAAEAGGDVQMTSPPPEQPSGEADGSSVAPNGPVPANRWRTLATVQDAHGPYEINHLTWCKRFDPGVEVKGVEEMLVTTGDDGVVRPWEIVK